MATIEQTRVMRTYRVELIDPTSGPVNQADVNLSFMVNAEGNPVDDQGRDITDVRAYVELQKRLRRLATMRKVPVTHKDLDTYDWQVRIVKARLVKVNVDETTGLVVKGERK